MQGGLKVPLVWGGAGLKVFLPVPMVAENWW